MIYNIPDYLYAVYVCNTTGVSFADITVEVDEALSREMPEKYYINNCGGMQGLWKRKDEK